LARSPIDWLEHPAFKGRLGLTECPGRSRPLCHDLEAIAASGAAAVVTLVEAEELHALGVADLGVRLERAGLAWYHLPITDFGTPDAGFEAAWAEQGPAIRRHLTAGDNVVVHCYAGLGRSGIVAARLLVEFGEPPPSAIALARKARRGAVQNEAQERYVLALRPPA
jgi:protein-tyrosine phosphatase